MNPDLFGNADGAFPAVNNAFVQGRGIQNMGAGNMWQMSQQQQQFVQPVNRRPPLLQSAQSNIVSSRSDQVSEQFGQITPPDELERKSFANTPRTATDSQQAEEDEAGKLNRQQRARNAANTRHSKSKKARQDSMTDVASEEGDNGRRSSKSVVDQREKNRIAAAKCRAKKKTNNEKREAEHREEAARHQFLKREERELRNEKTLLRSLILEHTPERCQCNGIHKFNMMQAEQLLREVGIHSGPSVSSPSQESASSVQTPVSEVPSAMVQSTPGPMAAQGRVSMSPRQQSFNGPPTYPGMAPQDGMPSIGEMAQDPAQMQQDFAQFLQNSPDGRAGFS